MADAEPDLPLPPAPAAVVPDPVPVVVLAVEPAPVAAPAPVVVQEVNFHFCLKSSVTFGVFVARVGFHALVVSLAYFFSLPRVFLSSLSFILLLSAFSGLFACGFW